MYGTIKPAMVKRCPDCHEAMIEFDMGSHIFHCANPDCLFQYVDCKTGKEFRKDKTGKTTI